MGTRKRVLAVAVGTMLVLALGATIVVAANVQRGKGTTIDRVKTAHTNVHSTVTDGTLDLPGARHSLILTKPSTLVVARFAATTWCTGGGGGCHADVVVLNNRNEDAQFAQMGPVGHMDSAGPGSNDGHEGHAIEQSMTLPPGDYDFQVRLRTFSAPEQSVTFHIAQWHFTVERIVE